MSGPDLQSVRRLVERVHDLDPDERSRVLLQECAGDEALRSEVEALLRAAVSTPGFLERSPTLPAVGELLPSSVPELLPGARLKGFRLLRRIASGGMGTVWEAEQEAPRRRVAVKVLRDGSYSEATVRRFQREPELLGRLRHPDIAQVIAAGVEVVGAGESQPWYALELVEDARSLTDFARERALDLRGRLELFARLCAAVQHGHERGVIHRDLKPGNVLIDGSGALKVIDFGVARALDGASAGTFQTEAGRVIGTLQYMSPEQIEGTSDGVDTRSDVYALGVMLYELTVGAPPFDLARASLAEAARVLGGDVPRPSARVGGYAPDLEAIVLCALERDPARRYGGAGELGSDTERFLRGDPVAARAPSAARHLARLARRHRAWAAAGLSIAAVSLVASAVSLRQAARAQRAEQAARARLQDVRGLARSVLFDLHDSVEHLAGATRARREIAAVALTYLDGLEADAPSDPGLLADLAEGRLRLGQALGAPGTSSLGDRAGARRELERAIAASERWLEIAPGAEAHLTRARARFALSSLERKEGRLPLARELLESAEREAADVAQGEAQTHAAEQLVERSRFNRAKVLALEGRTREAQALLEPLVDALNARRATHTPDPELWRDSTLVSLELGKLHAKGARPALAVVHLEQALALAAQRQERWPMDEQAGHEGTLVRTWLAVVRLELGQGSSALRELEEAAAAARELAQGDPDDSTARADLRFVLLRLGPARRNAGDAQGGLAACEEALRFARQDGEREDADRAARMDLAEALFEVGESLRALARPAESLEAVEQARDLLLALEAEQPEAADVARHLAIALARTADAALADGDGGGAAQGYAEALQRIERVAPSEPEHAWTQRMVMVLRGWRGVAHRAAAQRAEGEQRAAHLDAAIESLEAALELEPALNAAGFLRASDDAAIEHLLADLEACRGERRDLQEP